MEKYVIVCLRHRDMFFGGNGFLFWGPKSSGYTAVLQTAGIYTEEKAMQIFSEDDVPIPISAIGMEESDFIEIDHGFKKLKQLTLFNFENQDNKKLINQQREAFRHKKDAAKMHTV